MRPRDDDCGAPGEEPRRRGRRDGTPERDNAGEPVCDPAEGGPGTVADLIAEGAGGVTPGEVPHRLCAVALTLLPVTGASVSLRGDGMPVQMGASDEAAAHMAEIQATLGDGPSLYAAEIGAPVLAGDLTGGRDARRWPVFAQQAAEAGVQAVYSIPLGSDAVCVGTLDLYGATPHELSRRELHTVQLVAAAMTLALMSLPRDEDDEGAGEGAESSWLSGLLTDQDEVYQAIGMIMVQLGAGADEAVARLRARAFTQGRTALEVAHEVTTHRTRFDRD
ncbi:GAF and ANTAR domain-containing protein [Streptomyces sp. NPDC020801]|uniref:GAF and ANTAR domain-containing protein n=1 Tax=unclassified Streptomyces TaxID=2593676 RepID=UPI0037945738